MDRETKDTFQAYLEYRYRAAGAVTFTDKLAVLDMLEEESRERGRVPIGNQQVATVNVEDPAVKAVLEGRAVSLGGDAEMSSGKAKGLKEMGTGKKLAVLAAAVMVPFCLMGGVFFAVSAKPKMTPTPTLSAEDMTRLANAIPTTITPDPDAPVETVIPTPTLVLGPGKQLEPTPTPYNVQLYSDGVGSNNNDPASIELVGMSYMLSEGGPGKNDGVWDVKTGGEWLRDSEVRRVLAIPYSSDMANMANKMTAGDELSLRLRSGEVVNYKVSDVQRVKRQEIEVLTGKSPSLAVVMYGERAGDRWVISADAMQATDFDVYTPIAGNVVVTGTVTPAPRETPTATPTLIGGLLATKTIITDTLTVTNTEAGLVLAINSCSRIMQVGTAKPAKPSWEYLSCSVSLTAMEQDTYYSGFTLGVTELDWIMATEGWWPEPMSVPDGIGEGYIGEGAVIEGKIAGIVVKKQQMPGGPRTQPVVVWDAKGTRFIIDVKSALD